MTPCLLASPEPFLDESPASWVQRISGAHQYPLSVLSQVTNIYPRQADWDYHVTNDSWSTLLSLANAGTNTCGEARFALNTLRLRLPLRRHLFLVRERPCYRWCSACFSTDLEPYLRWHWRLAASTRCHVHRCQLEERCQWCKSPLNVTRAVLVSGRASDLSICARCGMPLATGEALAPDVREGDLGDEQMSAFIDRIREAYWRDDDQFEFDFSGYPDTPKPAKPRTLSTKHKKSIWIDMCIKRSSEQLGPIFQLNGQSFLDARTALAKPKRAFRWTDGLRASDRLKVAAALRAIRKERRKMRKAKPKKALLASANM